MNRRAVYEISDRNLHCQKVVHLQKSKFLHLVCLKTRLHCSYFLQAQVRTGPKLIFKNRVFDLSFSLVQPTITKFTHLLYTVQLKCTILFYESVLITYFVTFLQKLYLNNFKLLYYYITAQ
jgi:hypothetical protein